MKLSKKIAIFGIAAGVALSSLSYLAGRESVIMFLKNKEAVFKTQQIDIEPAAVYDSKTGVFTKHSGGINENFLNSSQDERYKEPDFIDYFQRVDNQEHRIKFRALEEYEGAISEILTFKTAIENINLIDEEDSPHLSSGKENKSLEELLKKCDRIYRTTEEGSIERIEKMYEVISLYIKPGKVTEDALSLKELVEEGVLGDCNDVSSSYYSLFNYYHIPCFIVSGGVRDNKEEGLHVWLRTYAKINGKEIKFEIDPTWYGTFVPLDTRNETCEVSALKEKFIKRKK
jgi:hypothetical protein